MSGHFNVLKTAGLIVSERSRRNVVYSINMSAFDDAAAAILSFLGDHRHPETGSETTEQSEHEEARDG